MPTTEFKKRLHRATCVELELHLSACPDADPTVVRAVVDALEGHPEAARAALAAVRKATGPGLLGFAQNEFMRLMARDRGRLPTLRLVRGGKASDAALLASFELLVGPERPDGCRLWQGLRSAAGYGRLWFDGRMVLAHRAAWRAAHGTWPAARLVVMHRCDVRACVNPEHLELGTQAKNVQDCIGRGRANRARGDRSGSRQHPESRPRGERNSGARLTESDVHAIRSGSLSLSALAERYGVARSTIVRIRSRRSWRHIP